MEEYLIIHLGEGKFQVRIGEEIKEAGSNLCGIIGYTYFENGDLPQIGWQVSRKKLMEDYLPKIHQDVLSGKIKPN